MRKLFGTSVLAIAAAVILAGMFIGCDKKEPTPSGGNNGGTQTVAVTGVSLSKTSLTLVEGGSETLTATVSPDNASNKSVSWKSSATDIATVDGSGKVTAVKAGSATITVTTADGGKTATCSVTVTEQAKIVITGNTAKVPVSGGTAEFPIQYNTSYTIEIESSAQSWLHFVETRAMQSGTLVFSVDANKGEARTGKATVKDNDGKVEPITLTFEQEPYIAVTSVQLSPEAAELEVGETLTLTVTVLPENATDKTVTWSSSNSNIVSIDATTGAYEIKGIGSATITASAGNKTATCTITGKATYSSLKVGDVIHVGDTVYSTSSIYCDYNGTKSTMNFSIGGVYKLIIEDGVYKWQRSNGSNVSIRINNTNSSNGIKVASGSGTSSSNRMTFAAN